MALIRTQIQLSDAQMHSLKRLAVERGTSVAALIRESVDRTLATEGDDAAWERALSVVGAFRDREGAKDAAAEHDRYLEDAYEDWQSS